MNSKRKWYFIFRGIRKEHVVPGEEQRLLEATWVFAAKDLQRHAEKPALNPHSTSGKIIVRLLCASAK